nr:uncharacterized protein LOC126054696 [Helicoverpa armigera]
MDELNDNVDLCALSGSEIMQQETTIESEQQLNVTLTEEREEQGRREQRLAEKRTRQDDEEIVEEDGFVTVIRNHKRLNRMNSTSKQLRQDGDGFELENYESEVSVCVTGKETLPKQFGMAKLLRSFDIQNITKITYRNAYRVLIYFDNRESALKLLNCEKFTSLGYRVQRTDEVNLCYGIVRQVDLETEEKEIMENLSCELDIISIKRLRRITDSGEWTDSETIRIGFKGNTLPLYVYGYGCRFKVEPYTFPVSQCSGCWKYGHLSRSCPIKKIICPKCGNNHANCETNKYVCVNCKGPHMAMFKKCPVFLKEKEIRNIMTKQNCTYRKGLELYLKNKQDFRTNADVGEMEINKNTMSDLDSQQNTTQKLSYRDIVITDALIHNNNSTVNNTFEDEGLTRKDTQENCVLENKKTKSRGSVKKSMDRYNVEPEIRNLEKDKSYDSTMECTKYAAQTQ